MTAMIRCHGGLILLSILLGGCGNDQLPTYPTHGKVVFPDGRPVRTGVVELESMDHDITATGKINTDGTFVLGTYDSDDGAVSGFHRVIVLQMVINDGTINHTMDHGKPVDSQFASYESSTLTATIVPEPENVLTLEVTAASERAP